jgi:hypothetical protein
VRNAVLSREAVVRGERVRDRRAARLGEQLGADRLTGDEVLTGPSEVEPRLRLAVSDRSAMLTWRSTPVISWPGVNHRPSMVASSNLEVDGARHGRSSSGFGKGLPIVCGLSASV